MLNLKEKDEKLLFDQIAAGNEGAFRIIYDNYFDFLATYVFKIAKSALITEEIVQDVFMKIWINRAALNQIEIPRAYIYSIARNRTIDYLRKVVRETDLINEVAAQSVQSENRTDANILMEEMQVLISTAMEQLSHQKQKIFQLSYFEDYSHDEIAKKLNISKSTVKNHLSETLKYLRKRISTSPNSDFLIFIFIIGYWKKY